MLDENQHPESGTITTAVATSIILSDGTIVYSHSTAAPLVENVGCDRRRHGPVSGLLNTIYRDDTVSVDFGDGSCDNTTITITINSVTTTKIIGS